MSSTTSRIIQNTGWLYAKMAITMFLTLYTTRLILSGLGASDFGIYNIVGSSIAMLGFINAALSATTQRFMNYAEGEGDHTKKISIFNVSIVLHFAIACIMGAILICSGIIIFKWVLNIPEDRQIAAQIVYGCLLLSTIFDVMTVPYVAVLNSHENMRYFALIGVFEAFLKLAVAYVCLWSSQDKLVVYGFLMMVIPVTTLTIMRVYCHKHYNECKLAIRQYFRKEIAFKMSSFAGWTFFYTVTSMVTLYGVNIIVNHFFGVIVNAAHGIAMQLSGMLMAFSSNAQKAYNPILTKSEGAHDRNRMIYISLFGCRISYYLFGIFSIPVILLMPEILTIWLKEVPEWAVIFCRLQLVRILLEQLVISLVSAINAEGNIREYSLVRSIISILPIPLAYIAFLWGYPPYWMYIIWIICWAIIAGLATIYYSKIIVSIPITFYCKQVLFPCSLLTIISILPNALAIIFAPNNNFQLLAVIIQIIVFSIGGIYLILKQEERIKLLSFAKKIVNNKP